MDYIIFGLGLGATLTLMGWAFREWGSSLRDRSSSSGQTVLSGYELVNRMAWQRFCRSCGAVLAIFGLLVLLATIIATTLMLPNSTGATVVLATVAVCAIATLVWLGLFLHRFGSRGILRPRSATPAPSIPVTKAEPGKRVGAARGTSPVLGPPIPPADAWLANDPRVGPDVMDPGDDMTADEADPDHDDRLPIEVETDDSGEHVAEEELSGEDDEPEDESQASVETGADGDSKDDPVDDDGVNRDDDGSTVPEPEAGTRRVVMLTAREDDEEPHLWKVDADRDNATSHDAGSPKPMTDKTPEEGGPRDDASSRADPESGYEGASEADIPVSSGRAEAVRKLRQRRIKRLARDSSAQE